MSNKKTFPGILCSALGRDYQVLSDERYVYIVRLGRAGAGDHSQAIAAPEDFAPILGNVRIVKSEIKDVRCIAAHRRMTIEIVSGENSARLTTYERMDEDRLLELFRDVPIHMSSRKRSPMAVEGNWLEIGMFFACFVLALLGIAFKSTPGMTAAAKWLTLGWMVIPPAWLALTARRRRQSSANQGPFALGIGAMASLFACVFLWLTPEGKPLDWTQALLPVAIVTAAAVALYALCRRKLEPLPLIAVALVALVGYAPGTVLCANELPAPRAQTVETVEVVEMASQYNRGDYVYYVVVENDGVQSGYRVSREEYGALTEGGTAKLVHTTGTLGIEYVDVICE